MEHRAAIFPGQGSQHVGMGKFLFEEFKTAKHLFEEASDALSINYKKLCFEGPDSDLALTENTQPALLLVSFATFKVLDEQFGFKPSFVAGHSLGEYSALVAAEAFSFVDGMRTVRARGQAMQEAVPVGKGAMLAALGLTFDEVTQLCHWAEEESGCQPLSPANDNAPGQVVISGSKIICDWLQANFDSMQVFNEKKRVKLIPLNVSAPFHCSMMKPAEEKMALVLNQLKMSELRFPVVQNVTALPSSDVKVIRENLISQISAPVRWVQSVKKMSELGVKNYVECGPSKVLAGLVKKIDSESTTLNIQSLEDIKAFEKA